ncbi:MAG: hypothetical protein JO316_05310 [Abitibacteriaceae bacterium]|nr:hypothetical protein [Abditibacteriaceae bacterium]
MSAFFPFLHEVTPRKQHHAKLNRRLPGGQLTSPETNSRKRSVAVPG